MATAALAHAVDGGLLIQVRAAPKARREGIEGVVTRPRGPALKIALAAPPADGRANARLIEILAKALDVPKSAVSIRTGTASRDKTIFVAGDPPTLFDAVARIAPAFKRDHHG
ncbi:MAG TPA: DUF167 domain-containing protein [Alphaproteobacteria bacterium]|nr:DUF167 domain-containing protein [Alphaproteobacteria bacterium]